MNTKDPQLTKTRIDGLNNVEHNSDDAAEHKSTLTMQETLIDGDFIDEMEHLDDDPVDASMANRRTDERIAGESLTHEEPLRQTVVEAELAERDIVDQDTVPTHSNDELAANTSINKGTDTFKDGVVDSKHVNDGDDPARQPDRRDQQGSTAFDEGINEETVGSEAPQSHEINDMNRYANVDNAQTRILNPDEKD